MFFIKANVMNFCESWRDFEKVLPKIIWFILFKQYGIKST